MAVIETATVTRGCFGGSTHTRRSRVGRKLLPNFARLFYGFAAPGLGYGRGSFKASAPSCRVNSVGLRVRTSTKKHGKIRSNLNPVCDLQFLKRATSDGIKLVLPHPCISGDSGAGPRSHGNLSMSYSRIVRTLINASSVTDKSPLNVRLSVYIPLKDRS